jgi:hypothetical protein
VKMRVVNTAEIEAIEAITTQEMGLSEGLLI